jgi:hypothetical protein
MLRRQKAYFQVRGNSRFLHCESHQIILAPASLNIALVVYRVGRNIMLTSFIDDSISYGMKEAKEANRLDRRVNGHFAVSANAASALSSSLLWGKLPINALRS